MKYENFKSAPMMKVEACGCCSRTDGAISLIYGVYGCVEDLQDTWGEVS